MVYERLLTWQYGLLKTEGRKTKSAPAPAHGRALPFGLWLCTHGSTFPSGPPSSAALLCSTRSLVPHLQQSVSIECSELRLKSSLELHGRSDLRRTGKIP